MKDRIVFLDISRAFAVIWIVAFWHLNQYLKEDILFFTHGSGGKEEAFFITNGVLALFTLISGYFMSQKIVNSNKDILEFYRKRFLRFGLPLSLSCLILSIMGYISYAQVLTICIGISQLFPPPYPRTMWFFSMIILFYLITPYVLWIRKKNYYLSLLFIITIFVFLEYGVIQGLFDKRITDNYPFYMFPFVMGKKNIFQIYMTNWHYIISLTLVTLFFVHIMCGYTYYFPLLYSSSTCFLVISVSVFISQFAVVTKFFSLLSYASMFAYLYHRELYIFFSKIFGKYNYCEAVLIVVVLFLVSFYLQLMYNKVSNKILINNTLK